MKISATSVIKLIMIFSVLSVSSSATAQRLAEWTEGPGELGLGYPVPQPVDTPLPFDGFRSYTGLHLRHQDLMNQSDRVTGEITGQTRKGRDIWAYRLGRPGSTTPDGQARGSIMYAGGVHAREWQSPEVVTGLMERVAAGAGDQSLTDYVNDHINIVIQPVTNIDGFLLTQANPANVWMDIDNRFPEFWPRDGRMRRKNLSATDEDFFTTFNLLGGVDLNRNNSPFFPGPPDTGIREDLTWRGPSPQSEPEIQALLQASALGPADRLRFYADMHSYTRVFFSVFTSNARRNSIQRQLFRTLANHHASLPGGQVYLDSPSSINAGIGTTSEYFGHTYQIPSATWEIEPGGSGGVQYGGFGSNGHDGFILPESEIRRVRENLAESMLVAAYHMAGPPTLLSAEIRDVDTQAIVWSAQWSDPDDGERELTTHTLAALVPGRAYEAWLGFSKPMRWREGGQIVPFPGRPSASLELDFWLESSGQALDADYGEPEWLDQPGGPSQGYFRYKDDAVRIEFSIADSQDSRSQIEFITDAENIINLRVHSEDLTGHDLDANPSTAVDWNNGAWKNYESGSGALDTGGADRSLNVDVQLESLLPESVRAVHTAMWFDPERSGEGWVIEILDNQSALGYWFTFDEAGNPRWLIGQGPVVANQIIFDELFSPIGGEFGPGFDPADVEMRPAGSARFVMSDCDNGWLDYRAFGQTQRLQQARLTRTQGLSCDSIDVPPSDLALQSGSWFDPTHNGEGYTVQWLVDDRVLVMWFSYDPQGQQYWMIAVGAGPNTDGSFSIEEVMSARGAKFGRAFDTNDVELFDWGSIQMRLGCESGTADYQSILPEFGSGDFALARLSSIAGLTACTPH